jgi:hypothetical protein
MLLEDEARGTTVNCLVCRQPITIEGTGSGSRDSASAATQAAAADAGQPAAPMMVKCPNPQCRTSLKLPSLKRGQSIRCPKCKQVFKP